MSTTTNWVGSGPKKEAFFDVTKGWFLPPEIPFEPFAQKLVLPAGSRVILQGDLHGDVRSLLAVIDKWNDQKWLEGFRIVDPALHVIFLGDYTDRGVYGIVTSGPRSPPKSMGAQAQGLGVSPQGHYILTPLQQDDG